MCDSIGLFEVSLTLPLAPQFWRACSSRVLFRVMMRRSQASCGTARAEVKEIGARGFPVRDKVRVRVKG